MSVMGLSSDIQKHVLSIVAGVLHIGNIDFVEKNNYAEIANRQCQLSVMNNSGSACFHVDVAWVSELTPQATQGLSYQTDADKHKQYRKDAQRNRPTTQSTKQRIIQNAEIYPTVLSLLTTLGQETRWLIL